MESYIEWRTAEEAIMQHTGDKEGDYEDYINYSFTVSPDEEKLYVCLNFDDEKEEIVVFNVIEMHEGDELTVARTFDEFNNPEENPYNLLLDNNKEVEFDKVVVRVPAKTE